jgi:hypothetical protein
MKLRVKCPSCRRSGVVPHRFAGVRIRCLSCRNPFVLSFEHIVGVQFSYGPQDIPDNDSIELHACPKCSGLGFRSNHPTGQYFRCPDCDALSPVEATAGRAPAIGARHEAKG